MTEMPLDKQTFLKPCNGPGRFSPFVFDERTPLGSVAMVSVKDALAEWSLSIVHRTPRPGVPTPRISITLG